MNIETFIAAIFIAVSYTAWPNLSKALNVNTNLIAFIAILIALVVITVIAFNDLGNIISLSTKASLWILAICAVNGSAIYVHANMAAKKEIQTRIFLASISILQVVSALIIDWLVNGEIPTNQQMIGLGLSIPTLLLLFKL